MALLPCLRPALVKHKDGPEQLCAPIIDIAHVYVCEWAVGQVLVLFWLCRPLAVNPFLNPVAAHCVSPSSLSAAFACRLVLLQS